MNNLDDPYISHRLGGGVTKKVNIDSLQNHESEKYMIMVSADLPNKNCSLNRLCQNCVCH